MNVECPIRFSCNEGGTTLRHETQWFQACSNEVPHLPAPSEARSILIDTVHRLNTNSRLKPVPRLSPVPLPDYGLNPVPSRSHTLSPVLSPSHSLNPIPSPDHGSDPSTEDINNYYYTDSSIDECSLPKEADDSTNKPSLYPNLTSTPCVNGDFTYKDKDCETGSVVSWSSSDFDELPATISRLLPSTSDQLLPVPPNNSTSNQPLVPANSSTSNQPLVPANSSTSNEFLMSANNSTSDQPLVPANNSTSERFLVPVDNSTSCNEVPSSADTTGDQLLVRALVSGISDLQDTMTAATDLESSTLSSQLSSSAPPSTANNTISSEKEHLDSLEQPGLDQPALDQPARDQPALDQPALDQPTLDQPILDQPALDQPILDQPVLDQSILDQPLLDQPILDQPILDQLLLDQPILDQPALLDQPTLDQPMTSLNGISSLHDTSNKGVDTVGSSTKPKRRAIKIAAVFNSSTVTHNSSLVDEVSFDTPPNPRHSVSKETSPLQTEVCQAINKGVCPSYHPARTLIHSVTRLSPTPSLSAVDESLSRQIRTAQSKVDKIKGMLCLDEEENIDDFELDERYSDIDRSIDTRIKHLIERNWYAVKKEEIANIENMENITEVCDLFLKKLQSRVVQSELLSLQTLANVYI